MTSSAYQLFRELMQKGRYAEAVSLAQAEQQAAAPDDAFWLTRQAAALLRLRDYTGALAASRQALARQPANPYASLTTAQALYGLKHTAEALLHYEAAATEKKLAAAACKGALACLAQGKQWHRILDRLALWKLPETQTLYWKAKTLQGLGRTQEAADVCRKWLQISPDDPRALWMLTELEIRIEGLEAVRTRMGRLARISSRPPIYKEIFASLSRRSGRIAEALAQYETLADSTADPRLLRQHAFTLAKSGRETEALPLLEELLKIDPADFYLHASYTGACRRIKQLDRALKFYEDLLDMHPAQKGLYTRMRNIRKLLDPDEAL